MNRRTFTRRSALAATVALLPATRLSAAVVPPEKMARIGCGTFTFRNRFPAMSLLAVPEFFAKELGIHIIEINSRHFAEQSRAYCKKVRAAAEAAGSKVVNVQVDEKGYNLSAPKKEERAKSVQLCRKWMEMSAACGATSMRANTGGGRGASFDLEVTADSFRQLAARGKELGVKILVENHGGHSSVAENVVAILEAVDSPWCRSLPDFGNCPGTREERHAFLRKLLPTAHLISAKGVTFDKDLKHSPYDIGACVRLAEAEGFTGIYAIEQWAKEPLAVDELAVAKRMVEIIGANLS